MTLFSGMLWALALTESAELLFAYLWGLRSRQLTLVFLMNVLTNPAANLLHVLLVQGLCWPQIPVVIALELAVVITESFCCRGCVAHPVRFALCVNGFSYGIGLLTQFLF